MNGVAGPLSLSTPDPQPWPDEDRDQVLCESCGEAIGDGVVWITADEFAVCLGCLMAHCRVCHSCSELHSRIRHADTRYFNVRDHMGRCGRCDHLVCTDCLNDNGICDACKAGRHY